MHVRVFAGLIGTSSALFAAAFGLGIWLSAGVGFAAAGTCYFIGITNNPRTALVRGFVYLTILSAGTLSRSVWLYLLLGDAGGKFYTAPDWPEIVGVLGMLAIYAVVLLMYRPK